MAQYLKNFYSSTLYGRIKAFFGQYTTESFDAQEKFSSTVNVRMETILPLSFYDSASPEYTVANPSPWNMSGGTFKTATAGAALEFNATGDQFEIHALYQDKGNQVIEGVLYQERKNGESYEWVEVERKNFNTLSPVKKGQVAKFAFARHGFADYKVNLTVSETFGTTTLYGVQVRTGEVALELSASANGTTWTDWEPVTLTDESSNGSQAIRVGESQTQFSNVQLVKGRISLYTSDNSSSPVLDRLELRSEDSGLYETAGDYTAEINMNKVAESVSGSTVFKRVDKIRFVDGGIPERTELTVRSSSSRENTFWGPITAPYKPNTKRLRLKRGIYSHSVTIGPIDERNGFDFVDISSFRNWDTEAYKPKSPAGTEISYFFSKTKNDVLNPNNKLQTIADTLAETNRAITFNPQPYFLQVKLVGDTGTGTPVVDMISIEQDMAYKQTVNVIEHTLSGVDGDGSGVKKLQRISDSGFTYPSTAGKTPFNANEINLAQQRYTLEDKTGRPSDVMIYLKSEEAKGTRSNASLSATDEIVAKAIHRNMENGDTSGVIRHHQYGAGEVQYLRPYEREVGSSFTPSLDTSIPYRYFVKNGWPVETHRVIAGQTLSELAEIHRTTEEDLLDFNGNLVLNEDGTLLAGQTLKLPNLHENDKVDLRFENGTLYSEKSSHNARILKNIGAPITDMSSEKLAVEVLEAPELGYVDWESEEKIYTGVINADDVRGEFIGTQYNRSANSGFNRDYRVAEGDTWDSIAAKYAVDVSVLKVTNRAAELKAGEVIVIPPNILLPELAAEAEFSGSNPYQVTIVPNSVQKKDGTLLDESFIPVDWSGKRKPLTMEYRESGVLTAQVTRGSVKHGMDPLPLSNVLRIVSIRKGAFTYHEWNETLATGDFKLNSNYIDWSPSKAGTVEPAAGEVYTVAFVRQEVDNVEVFLDTVYSEKIGTDIVWRSPEVKVFEGVCTPTEDFRTALPKPEDFQGFSLAYQNVDYVIEDNDLWVETKMEETSEGAVLIGSLNGKDPSKNWHPTIETGYYYLKEQEHYLYSEPLKTVLGEKELPHVKGIEYVNGPSGIGALLMPSGTNHVRDSEFATKTWKKSKIFPALPLTAADMWVLGVSRL